MSNSDPDQDVRDHVESNDADTELSTDGVVSLFTTVLSNALEQQKNNIIQHFESRFSSKSEKATDVDATDFSFKHEGNRIQYSLILNVLINCPKLTISGHRNIQSISSYSKLNPNKDKEIAGCIIGSCEDRIQASQTLVTIDNNQGERNIHQTTTTSERQISVGQGFSGFLRYSELTAIKAKTITIFNSYMSILFKQSKTDIYWRGNSVIISKTGGNLSPFKWLLEYLQLANMELDSDQYNSHELSYLKIQGIHKLCSKNSPLSYTRAQEILLEAFESVGLYKSKFGLHSLRSSGFSTAANVGISGRLLTAHGRWATDKSQDGKIKDNHK
ncbi:unnamed protein product [Mytilus coruscus]|uniref:Tyr recombinase domain-containing protein n=1 Tax=Mytilus coruscus TaxID=42192 RepID=A0A6J8CC74_MYTCO|nr:unnamed protein product [Mytilus coruscus]